MSAFTKLSSITFAEATESSANSLASTESAAKLPARIVSAAISPVTIVPLIIFALSITLSATTFAPAEPVTSPANVTAPLISAPSKNSTPPELTVKV